MKLPILLSILASGLASACIAAEPPPPPPADVVVYDHAQVDAAFGKGFPICINSSYKIMAGRRVMAGRVEMHAHDTDIFYIVDGTATFVTGGTCSDLKEGKPGEFGGTAITGGTEHHLAKGDVITIPAGILHQYTVVDAPFLYFVVKVTR
jgi:mannose-6-phosphate isomerase-like protein (cupin superfamily)